MQDDSKEMRQTKALKEMGRGQGHMQESTLSDWSKEVPVIPWPGPIQEVYPESLPSKHCREGVG